MRWELEGQQMQDGTGNQTKGEVGRIGKERVKQNWKEGGDGKLIAQ